MRHPRATPAPSPRHLRPIPAWRTIPQPISKRFLSGVITGLRHGDPVHRYLRAISTWQSSHLSALRHGDPAQRYPRGIILWRDGLKPVIYLCSSMKLAFFMEIEVWIGSLAIKPAFIIADEVRQGGRTVLQARRPSHNYPRGDPGRGNPDRGDPGRGDPGRGNPDRGDSGRGGNAHFADNPCLFTGKMVYLRPHNFRAG